MLKDQDEKTGSKLGCKANLKQKERVYELTHKQRWTASINRILKKKNNPALVAEWSKTLV